MTSMSNIEQTMGQTQNLMVLCFFIERPGRSYTISKLNRFIPLSRGTIRNWVRFYEDQGYIESVGPKSGWILVEDHPMVRVFTRLMFDIADVLFEESSTGGDDQ